MTLPSVLGVLVTFGILAWAWPRNRMATGRASRTAIMVAYWRAVASRGVTSVPNFSDPFAEKLIEGTSWRRFLVAADRRIADPRWREGMRPSVDAITSRVAFIDAVLGEVRLPQVVILGAGLDTRAWRLDVLRGATVYEVDHPATQAFKRANAGKLGPPLGAHVYVPVDFAKDELEAALAKAGHDAAKPTAWVWEGVVMYLDDAAVRSTLRHVRARSSPASALIAHYHEPETSRRRAIGRRILFTLIGEAQIGLRTRGAMHILVQGAGFEVVEDAGIAEQAARVGAIASDFPVARVSRILVARPR